MPANTLRLWVNVVLIEFFIAACIGVMLRYAFVVEIPFIKYKYVLHAHTHVAMMGWLFGALYILIVKAFADFRPIYSKMFWLFQIAILGMLISFPIQGYGPVSITFTTLHMLVSYLFMYHLLKDLRKKKVAGSKFLKSALLFLFLSTVATWMLGPLMRSADLSTWYYHAVQFFLHFQFNGWFIFALLALFFNYVTAKAITIDAQKKNRFYLLLFVSCILTYALAVTWSTPDRFIFWVNSVGVVIQLFALLLIIGPIWKILNELKPVVGRKTRFLWTFSMICLGVKILIQTCVAVPQIAIISYTVHNFVIGFIHLLMLGALSTFMIGAFHEFGIKRINTPIKNMGLLLFIVGIVLSEIVLFGQGVLFWARAGFMPYYHLVLTLVSACIPVGIALYGYGRSKLTLQHD